LPVRLNTSQAEELELEVLAGRAGLEFDIVLLALVFDAD
jgi:hypothetical protein